MIKILQIADLHGQFGKLDSFLSLEPDLVVISGDITENGPVDVVPDLLDRIEVPVFVVPGNCDPRDILDVLEDSSAVCLHGSTMTLGKVTLTGIGGSNKTPFGTPFELTEEQIEGILNGLTSHLEKNVHNILVTHAPPEGTLDRVGEAHVGSPALRKFMKHFDLVCSAHIHDDRGEMEVDGVRIVNPGPASEGHCAMIQLGDEPRDITIKILSV
ncbi:MAG: metallophosphoesterase [Methanomicrobiales archaeon]|nr:metallophosphoesterase [Methanomicrobiales archaeon]